jgi:hypothetical protein
VIGGHGGDVTPRARVGIATAVALVVALVPAAPAGACSCAAGNPRDRLQEAGAAFIGRLLEVEGDVQTARYTFAVDEAIKGSFAETITIETAGNGAACGFELDGDRPSGILLHRWRHGWSSGLCSQIDPDELRSAVAPLQVSPHAGPAIALAGGSFGEAQVAALDAGGRVVAWGWGRGVTYSVSVCAGGDVALEHVTAAPAAGLKGEESLYVRELGDLETRRLSFLPGRGLGNIYRVVCASPDATSALVASTRGLFLARDHGFERLVDGAVYDAVLAEPDVAYAIGKRSIVRVRLDTGRARRVGTFDDRRLSLELSQDGRQIALARDWVAAESSPWPLVARLDREPLRLRTVARETLRGFPAAMLPEASLPADTFDVSALERPTRIVPLPAPPGPDGAEPSFGPLADPPRSSSRTGDGGASSNGVLLGLGGLAIAAVLAIAGAIAMRRRGR